MYNKNMYNTRNDYRHEHSKKEYAEAYVKPQVYKNLYSVNEAFVKGTIFEDLYRPYDEKKKKKTTCS